MDTALIIARCLLAGVFVVAGLAKLADLPGSRVALTGFGVPQSLVPSGAVALPSTEILVAILLLIAPTAQVGGALAALLLAGFVIGIARALRRGRAPECHCFGQLHSRPAGRGTLVRNGLLALPAIGVAVAGPGPGIVAWARDEGVSAVALVVTSASTILLALLTYRLWQENRRLTGQGSLVPDYEPPLPIGHALPDFEVRDLQGSAVGDQKLVADGRGILVFVSATCGPCHALLPDIARWQDLLGGRLAVHVISTGDRDTNTALADEHGLPLMLDADARASNAFRVPATPCAIEYDAAGLVASDPATGAIAIEALIRKALKRPSEEPFVLSVRDGRSA